MGCSRRLVRSGCGSCFPNRRPPRGGVGFFAGGDISVVRVILEGTHVVIASLSWLGSGSGEGASGTAVCEGAERIAELLAEGAFRSGGCVRRCNGHGTRFVVRCWRCRGLRRGSGSGLRCGCRRRSVRRSRGGLVTALSLRAIATGLGRSPSTVSREVARNGGRRAYRACRADRAALRRACRPRASKLVSCPRLRAVVEAKLELRWSPQQISGWLVREFPDDPEMRVSHETIYLSLFVQSRGALRKELTRYLRTQRSRRRPAAYPKHVRNGQGQIRNLVHISERPAEADDRAVPGHWEGDLIYGQGIGTVATLVERSSRFVMLVGLPSQSHRRCCRRRARREDRRAARPAATFVDLGPRQGDGHALEVHRRQRRAGLLLRPAQPLAARHQREHQRPVAPIPAAQVPLRGTHPTRARRDRCRTQRTTPQDPRLANPSPSPRDRVALTD